MNNEATFRITPRLIIGFGILALGMLWTLDNLDVLDSDPITRWWPAVLVVIGAVQLFDKRVSRFVPIALIGIGTLLLLNEADRINFRFRHLFPLAVALVGAKLAWEALTRRGPRQGAIDADSEIHAFAIMAGVKRQSTATDFRGGDANAIMGGVEIDLRNAKIREGEDAVIDAFAMWGGVEIQVPQNWRVVGDVLPIMGAFEDNTHPSAEPGPTLRVRGTAIMGGIEVKN